MKTLKTIYRLQNDNEFIKNVQAASLDTTSRMGFKIENGLIFGSEEWFKALDSGLIPKHTINGIISRVYLSGHNDFPEFEIECNGNKSVWERRGIDKAYIVGRNIELTYVTQKYKRPIDLIGSSSKCVIEIKISE